jgi:diguanylate cyclase (GGDEF)-like protein
LAVRKDAQVVAGRDVARQLAIAIAGFGALGAVGFADATIGDDVDLTAIYFAIIAAIAWTSRLAVANLSAITGLVASLGADVVAHPPDLDFVLVWNGAGGLAAFVGVAMVVHYARAERDELRVTATHDSLTGLPNRVLFLDRLEHALALSRRRGPGPSVLALDLDGFKQVNDIHGHHAGDAVLLGTAERLTSCVRASDTCARLGGDEFAILLPYGGAEGSARVVAAIERAFGAPFTIDGKSISLHPSIGCAIAPADGDATGVLLRVADERMYRDKSTGAGRIPGGAPKPEHLYLDG